MSTTVQPASAAVTIEMCDPREREIEIKDLFARNGKPEFAAVFERAYLPRAASGMRSWIGTVDGTITMHVSVAPLSFTGDGRTSIAGLLGDLMVDESHRDFWAPVRLIRTMVADVKRQGNIDFLISTTVKEAESIFKAGGFKPFATARRYVLPLYWPYLLWARLRGRVASRRAHEVLFAQAERPHDLASLQSKPLWRPKPEADYYSTRIGRGGFLDGTWLSVPTRRGTPGCVLVSRCGSTQTPEFSIADAFWDENVIDLGEVIHAAGRWASRHTRKLTLSTLQESHAAASLIRAGFLPREVLGTLLVLQTGQQPPPVERWFAPLFSFSGW